jgi:hypothetical protein
MIGILSGVVYVLVIEVVFTGSLHGRSGMIRAVSAKVYAGIDTSYLLVRLDAGCDRVLLKVRSKIQL